MWQGRGGLGQLWELDTKNYNMGESSPPWITLLPSLD